MNPETTLEMIYRWLLEGKKIRHRTWGEGEFLRLINGMTYDECEEPITYSFPSPHEWELYQEPKEKEKWYQVISHNKDEPHPYIDAKLYRSERDFLGGYGYSKEDFHWIKLVEVNYDT
ncbi:MAG: hypothetical protein ACKOW2_08715 [Sphingobacteriaceae bacterium]